MEGGARRQTGRERGRARRGPLGSFGGGFLHFCTTIAAWVGHGVKSLEDEGCGSRLWGPICGWSRYAPACRG